MSTGAGQSITKKNRDQIKAHEKIFVGITMTSNRWDFCDIITTDN